MNIDLLDAIRAVAGIYSYPLREVKSPFSNLEHFDQGLRKALQPDFDFVLMGRLLLDEVPTPGFLLVEDYVCCRYGLFALPETPGTVYLVGPWVQGPMPEDRRADIAHIIGQESADLIAEQYYRAIPRYQTNGPVPAISALIEHAYPGAIIQRTPLVDYAPLRAERSAMEPGSRRFTVDFAASNNEKRHEIESKVLSAVARGDVAAASDAFRHWRLLDGDCWNGTSLFRAKNQLLVYNTLLRKAAERNEIHPYYSLSVYDKYVEVIDNMRLISDNMHIGYSMIQEYCGCVHNHSLERYSPQIQKVINHINLHLTEHITLTALAQLLFVSPSYLSSRFKKEVGQSIVDYINERRICTAAERLIWEDLPVSQIAAQVGILDINYFSRLFKKITGVTPTAYRKSHSRKDL